MVCCCIGLASLPAHTLTHQPSTNSLDSLDSLPPLSYSLTYPRAHSRSQQELTRMFLDPAHCGLTDQAPSRDCIDNRLGTCKIGLHVVSQESRSVSSVMSRHVTSRRRVPNMMLGGRQVPSSRVLRARLSAMAIEDCECSLPEPNPEVGKGFPPANASLQACRLNFRSITSLGQF